MICLRLRIFSLLGHSGKPSTRNIWHSFIAQFEPDFLAIRIDDRNACEIVGASPWSSGGSRDQTAHEASGKPRIVAPVDEPGAHEIASVCIGECVESHGCGS